MNYTDSQDANWLLTPDHFLSSIKRHRFHHTILVTSLHCQSQSIISPIEQYPDFPTAQKTAVDLKNLDTKMKLAHLSFTACSLFGAALSQAAVATPATPRLSYLGTASITIASPFKVGQGPLGDRNVYAITGGSFAGPNFTGMYMMH